MSQEAQGSDRSHPSIGPDNPYMMNYSQEVLDKFIAQNNISSDSSILDEDELYIKADLMMQKSEKTSDMEQFLHTHNMLINHKKYRCALACYKHDDEPTAQIKGCVDRCQKGEARFNAFVSKLFEVRHSEFQACMQAKQKESLYSVITCYQDMFLSFDAMKAQIKTEQSYYQP